MGHLSDRLDSLQKAVIILRGALVLAALLWLRMAAKTLRFEGRTEACSKREIACVPSTLSPLSSEPELTLRMIHACRLGITDRVQEADEDFE